ncbi:WbqC family protein [Methylophilaceae bacterium]|jgi:hypothetical protein|nr:WbqC family protein [Methylophilaceae bacterium]|tara:strand:- start:3158 stop:3850 length:693 start_codon:yes stop_codon:yes gene_type:complete
MKKIAIVQSNYIPWKGYFDMISAVDEFILFDDVQFTRRDWRNRNQIKTSQGVRWLTVPVLAKGKYHQKIYETEIDGIDWASSHWKALTQNYSNTPCFSEIAVWLEPLYLKESYSHISQLNRQFIEAICNYLGTKTIITNSSDYALNDGKTQRLVELCRQAGATEYISGPAAKDYMYEADFADMDIKLTWFDYAGYQEYPQLWGDFIHEVSILDLLFNCGKDSSRYMRYVT